MDKHKYGVYPDFKTHIKFQIKKSFRVISLDVLRNSVFNVKVVLATIYSVKQLVGSGSF